MQRRILLALAVSLLALPLAGCNDPPPLHGAYFQNNTDETLLVIPRTARDKTPQKLAARTTTRLPLMFSTKGCEAEWLIYDSTGTRVVKDPGEVCRDQTITIP